MHCKDGSRVPILIGAALWNLMFSKRLSPSLDLTERAGRIGAAERNTLSTGRTCHKRCPLGLEFGDEVEWNEGVHTLFGWETDVGSDATWWYERIHPDRRESSVAFIM